MLDVKTWLEKTEMKVTEDRFLKPPALPYIVFTENIDVGGADFKNCIFNRDISIELYADRISKISEQKIEKLLNEKAIYYTKSRNWIESDKFFQTLYDFNLLEKNEEAI